MRNFRVVALSASASATSKTAGIADLVLDRLTSPSVTIRNIALRDLSLPAMLEYPARDAGLAAVNEEVMAADGVIVATPIYKASFSGLLKLYLDQLPQFALAGKTVLPIATGGSLAHVLALDFSLRPVLQSMGVRHAVQSFFVAEAHIAATDDGGFTLRPEAVAPLDEAIHHFRQSMLAADTADQLGHPRPERRAAG
ncbi:NADPH-dependent FMN reductase [Methylobrevis pamukkalensis]|uniref:FMN reductase (NADPH) n=1 Tax=Methylobrevis pamukkalensis TaxID=1439726 RepID=A0A1E3H617_9HYPH|nr:NADPH-dependent FMN reductase [Methylobrevis pamukkalensis]ODN71762.1 FMN reductase (NADPH) [Methylobrevis pamukkalensis]